MKKTQRPVFCDTCGGALRYSADGLKGVCPYCGNEYNFTDGKSEALALALSRANAYRLNCDFDEAIGEYRLITANNPEDAEAHWGLALSKYGIEYVADPATGRRTPTCHRTLKESILDDEDYLAAVKYADDGLAASYRAKAEEIDRLQRAIKARLEGEESFDVFLCFRSADDSGAPTGERAVARRIYDELARRGIKTFYSEATLKGRLGEDYEPIIYKALYSCKFFILIAFSEENIEAAWVKNEWSRFRDRVYEERLTNACCAVFSGISPSALPSFIRTQGVDLSKYPAGGYEIDIADNLTTILANKRSGARYVPPSAGTGRSAELSSLLATGQDALARGDFVRAAAAFSRAIDEDGCCGGAWLGAFLAEAEVRSLKGEKKLCQEISNRLWAAGSTSAECKKRLAENEHILYTLSSPYYKNAVKYCSADISQTLSGAKRSVMAIADKCNAALKLSLEECLKREGAAEAAYSRTEENPAPAGDGLSKAATIAGAALAGGALGYIFGRRRFRRTPPPPHGGFGGPGGPRPGGMGRGPRGGPGGPRGGGPRGGGPRGGR